MPIIKVRDSEAVEMALRRFKRSCERAGIIPELRRRKSYEKPTTTRRRKAIIAKRRQHKKILREKRRFIRLY